MTAIEHIQQEIKALPAAEQFSLWQALGRELNAFSQEDDESGIESAWSSELAARVIDVKEGRVELVPGHEADRQSAELFARLGIDWNVQTA